MAKKEIAGAEAHEARGPVSYPVHNLKGEEVGTIDLDGDIFGQTPNEALVFETVIWQRNRKRQGTHSCLTKGEMRGGNKKPWRQKGTGRARAGSNTSPIWVGGAVAHGPKPHDYETRVPKRTRRQALASVLSDKVQSKRLVVVDSFGASSGKTKEVAKALSALKVGEHTTTLLIKDSAKADADLVRGARNLSTVTPLEVKAANVYDLMRHSYLVATRDSLLELQTSLKARLNGEGTEGQA